MSTAFYLGDKKIKNFTIAINQGDNNIVLKNPAEGKHILDGKEAIVNGVKVLGKIPEVSNKEIIELNGINTDNIINLEAAYYAAGIIVVFDESEIIELIDAI